MRTLLIIVMIVAAYTPALLDAAQQPAAAPAPEGQSVPTPARPNAPAPPAPAPRAVAPATPRAAAPAQPAPRASAPAQPASRAAAPAQPAPDATAAQYRALLADPVIVRYEIRIVEEGGPQPATTKTVSLSIAMGELSLV